VSVGLFLDQGVVEAVHQCRLGRASSEQRCIVANRILKYELMVEKRSVTGLGQWDGQRAVRGMGEQDEQD
jgi:hypothetical protein